MSPTVLGGRAPPQIVLPLVHVAPTFVRDVDVGTAFERRLLCLGYGILLQLPECTRI